MAADPPLPSRLLLGQKLHVQMLWQLLWLKKLLLPNLQTLILAPSAVRIPNEICEILSLKSKHFVGDGWVGGFEGNSLFSLNPPQGIQLKGQSHTLLNDHSMGADTSPSE